jgi:hypothetical protein
VKSKINITEIGCENMDWIQLARERVQWSAVVNAVMNIWVPYKMIYFLNS